MRQAVIGIAVALLALTLLPLRALADQSVRTLAVSSVIAAMRAQAIASDAQAQYDLAIALLCGTQVQRDPVEAVKWMTLAAEQHHTGAMSVLGWMYMTGTGVDRDDGKAVPWLRHAAENNDTAAANYLGVLYALGNGVMQNNDLARQWFALAASQGADDAEHNLQILRDHPHGTGLPRAAVPNTLHPALSKANCQPVARTVK